MLSSCRSPLPLLRLLLLPFLLVLLALLFQFVVAMKRFRLQPLFFYHFLFLLPLLLEVQGEEEAVAQEVVAGPLWAVD